MKPWNPKALGALAIGVFLLLLALLADVIGVGREPGFGWKQTLVLLLGIACIGVGWRIRR